MPSSEGVAVEVAARIGAEGLAVATLGQRAEEDMKIMDRPGRPTDVAPVVAFLQSDASRWFRGANLTLDGGMSSHIMLHLHGVET